MVGKQWVKTEELTYVQMSKMKDMSNNSGYEVESNALKHNISL